MDPILIAATLIVLHNIDGVAIRINPDQIVVLVPTKEAENKGKNELIVGGVNCIIGLSDGKRVSVTETCEVVSKKMTEETTEK